MSISLGGYAVEPIRTGPTTAVVAQAVVTNSGAFNLAYPTSEVNPRVDYLVLTLVGGPLHLARFGWTKNETLDRFTFDVTGQRFRPLRGGPPTEVGVLSSDANTTRLKAAIPVSTNFASFPFRVSIGGTTFTVGTVSTDAGFGTPSAGTVEVSLDTGNLNWASADLVTYEGGTVLVQAQQFADVGVLGAVGSVLYLSPIPASGQYPLIRVGYTDYLTPIERANDAALSPTPAGGTVEWSRTTGKLALPAGSGTVYYDGCLFGFKTSVTITAQGTVNSPSNIIPVPTGDSDVHFVIPGVVRFRAIKTVSAFSLLGSAGVVEIDSGSGSLQFSVADRARYGSQTVYSVVPDLTLERGLSMRFSRNPAWLDDVAGVDTVATYVSGTVVWADPIIAAPTVIVPAVPEQTPAPTIMVSQGTGSFVGTLPDHEVPTTPGIGYILNRDTSTFVWAQYRVNEIIDSAVPAQGFQLRPLVLSAQLELETASLSNSWVSLVPDQDYRLFHQPGLVALAQTAGAVEASGTGQTSGSTLTDTTASFSPNPGDDIYVLSGPAAGVRSVQSSTSTTITADQPFGTASVQYEVAPVGEVVADRFWYSTPSQDPTFRLERIGSLGTASNSPRLSVPAVYIPTTRIRLDQTFATLVTVATDLSFSAVAAGTVQVSESTGNLNFATADLGKTAYSARALDSTEYTLQGKLGFVLFRDRLQANEEVLIRYNNGAVVEEYAAFLIRKELVQPHPAPTSILSFNPLNKPIASKPIKVWRGGRPQKLGVEFEIVGSTIRMLDSVPARPRSTALPSGSTVAPTENVYVDYYITAAVGGESNFTVAAPPILVPTVTTEAGSTEFTLGGDWTSVYGANRLVQLNREVYRVASASYAAPTTTIVVERPLRSDLIAPTVRVSSGTVPFASFTVPTQPETAARGDVRFRILGDQIAVFKPGRVIAWSDGGTPDFNSVVAASLLDSGFTEVTVAAPHVREYTKGGTYQLYLSPRPIFEPDQTTFSLSSAPATDLRVRVYRRIGSAVGTILIPPEYELDSSGTIRLDSPLALNESVVVSYTGAAQAAPHQRLRATYTHQIAPSAQNGLLGQVLNANYTTRLPDDCYFRVEKLSNLKAELIDQDSGATPAPRLGNPDAPKLWEQGIESSHYTEEHLANADIAARAALKYYHDGVELLEDVLTDYDGRVLGSADGRFRFDGSVTNPNRATYADVTNDIDDRVKAIDGPPVNSGPPFSVTFSGTYLPIWKPSKLSRFYPTLRTLYGVSSGATDPGATVVDLGVKPLQAVMTIRRRLPWAVMTAPALTGDTVLPVDAAEGAATALRPGFDGPYDYQIGIIDSDGTVLVPDSAPLDVIGTTPTSITIAGGLPIDVPAGATIRHVRTYVAAPATPYLKAYVPDQDLSLDGESGTLTVVDPSPPLDGSVPAIPPELTVQTVAAGEVLDATVRTGAVVDPVRFPALDGSGLDDDGNVTFPVQVNLLCEHNSAGMGRIDRERVIVNAGGPIDSITTAPTVATCNLDAPRTTITLTAGTWPAPAPKQYDLVEIRTGLNANSSFHQISSVGASSVTVTTPFATFDTGFTAVLTVSNTLATGTGTHVNTSFLTDGAANFPASGVRVGHTLVMTSGPNIGQRRQIVSVGTTSLSTTAFGTTGVGTYRVDDSLSTFSGTTELSQIHTDLHAILDTGTDPVGVRSALESFITHFCTTVVSSTTGAVSVTTALDDAGVNFTTLGVAPNDLIWIRSGTFASVQIVTTVAAHQLGISLTFPGTGGPITYKVLRTSDLSASTVGTVLDLLLQTDIVLSDLAVFEAALATRACVDDAGAYANGLVGTSLSNRVTSIDSRIADLDDSSGPVQTVAALLSGGDQLYEKRWTWIETRIGMEKGLLPSRERAVQTRQRKEREAARAAIRVRGLSGGT